MNPELLIYPGVAMFFLTFAVFLYTGAGRYRGVRNRDIPIKYYRLYNDGQEPPELRVRTRHLQNHFEVPPLFYVVLLFTAFANAATVMAVSLAWAFVALRLIHTVIHLGSNNVTHRFIVFIFGGVLLASLWAHLLLVLLTR